jgi:glycine dehydrogenase subunit 1
MGYIPHTDAERRAMLAVIGVDSIEDLFYDVPAETRFPALDMPPALSEMEVMWELQSLSEVNAEAGHFPTFLGAGAYYHYIPSTVDYVISRGEFYTAYTPYQPEISQGTLQAMFEYQSLIANLTGMDVSNASHYDGATSLAEAVILALNTFRQKRRKVVLSPGIHPEYREVVRTYTQGMGLNVTGDEDLTADLPALLGQLDEDSACLCIQVPSFLGEMEDVRGVAEAVHAAGALLVVVCDPISLGLFQPPGAYGADVVVGEGQPLGIPLSYGGPYLGFFATRSDHVRRMAGRLVGETIDADGRRGYVLTLSTREQHIRRERATSNICTNQGLMALAAAVYLGTMGKCGLNTVAHLCYHKSHYAAAQIGKLDGFEVVTKRPFFKEFVVRCPRPVPEINHELLDDYGIVGGYDLSAHYPHLAQHMLVCVTEMNTKDEIDEFVEGLRDIGGR